MTPTVPGQRMYVKIAHKTSIFWKGSRQLSKNRALCGCRLNKSHFPQWKLLQGVSTRSAPNKTLIRPSKMHFLSHKNGICTFMRCGIFIKNYFISQLSCFWVTILTYLTNSLSFLSDFCWSKNKNKPNQPLLYRLFQDSGGTSTSTETNNNSYQSPDTQLCSPKEEGVASPWGSHAQLL